MSTVDNHNCEDVIDPSYAPTSPDEIALFREKNKFMYDVFLTILQTPMGIHYVRQHEDTRNAQAVWREYEDYMRSSTRTQLQIEDLMTEITSTRLSPSYPGTSTDFIVKWFDKMRRYETLTSCAEHFSGAMKKKMLQNAVSDLKVFKDVKHAEMLSIAQGNPAMTYEQYVDML